ncbi:beta-N-acetylhexosaminidase [Micromonospora kangleipakensis]|uniref:beta-N-acetylhexosaminidase n=1 Tax=Micromonospora kangleipakensis TaxID=1077942 RepID=A0A4Q8BDT5_9ACTN|nr:glycoside hydrolase family 3 protein [Micromonospora kangleipakensis]RZU76072.1 beta-N-acetylhexosaminidase [Micromonospora kangleipakensis]
MRHWFGLRVCVAVVSVGALLSSTAVPSVAAGEVATGAADRVWPGHSDDATLRGKIISMLQHMTLQEKVGQLFVVEVYGQDANAVSPAMAAKNQALYGVDTPVQVIDKYKPGGVIYFDSRRGPDNVQNPRQIGTLSNGLQTAAVSQRQPIPLLISTDQEGGAVVFRLVAPATAMPGNMALGAGRSTADAHRSAEVIGTELAAVGINQNYAPVADVNVNPANPVIGVRSVGEDPALVSGMVAAQVDGYHDGGVATVAKHFPGHGDTAVDSHFGLPEVTHTREQLEAIDLPPFRAAIAEGVDTIMTAHVVLRSVDPSGAPATMSGSILTGLLREELDYDGLIVTDALDMGGATSTYPPNVAPVEAFKAGADQLVLAPQMDVAYNAVLDAIRSGEISTRRLDESVYRILRLKMKRGLFDDPFVDVELAEKVVGAPDHLADAQVITDHTTTLVKNDAGVLPLTDDPRDVLVTGWGVTTTSTLGNAIGQRGQTVTVRETGTTPSQATINQVVAEAANSDLVVVSTMNAASVSVTTGLPTASAAAQQALVKALLATGKPVVVSGMRNPYDISYLTEAPTYLATYGYTAAQMESLTRVLFGEVNPVGKLPVTIPRADGSGALYPFGHGLSYGG